MPFKSYQRIGSEVDLALFTELSVLLGLHARRLLLHFVEALDVLIVIDAGLRAEILPHVEYAPSFHELFVASALPTSLQLALHDVVALVSRQA